MKKLIFSLSILALLVVQIPLAAAALAPARGTCAVDLTGATNIFHSVWSGAGSHAFDIRYGGFLSATGGSNTVGIHNGGELDTYGGSNVVYLKSGATFVGLGGGSNTFYYEPGATITSPGGSPTYHECNLVVLKD